MASIFASSAIKPAQGKVLAPLASRAFGSKPLVSVKTALAPNAVIQTTRATRAAVARALSTSVKASGLPIDLRGQFFRWIAFACRIPAPNAHPDG